MRLPISNSVGFNLRDVTPKPLVPLGAGSGGMEEVLCDGCGTYVHFARCRVMSKQQGTWKCLVCCSKSTQLYRCCGRWPLPEHQGIPDEDKQRFMRSIAGMGMKDVKLALAAFIERYTNREDYFERGGAFLPLNVWGTQGFDVEAIAQHSPPEDIDTHEVLGTVYRVRILTSGVRGSDGMRRSSQWQASEPPAKRQKKSSGTLALGDQAAPKAGDEGQGEDEKEDVEDEPKEGEEDEEDDDDDDDDSSSSTSSSSSSASKKRHKKHSAKHRNAKKDKKKKKAAKKAAKAKAKKEKKERDAAKQAVRDEAKRVKLEEKKEKADSAKKEKQTAQIRKLAVDIVKKLAPLKEHMMKTLDDPNSDMVPVTVKKATSQSYKDIVDLIKTSTRRSTNDTVEYPYTSMKDQLLIINVWGGREGGVTSIRSKSR